MKRAATYVATGLLATAATITLAGAAHAADEYNLTPPNMTLIGCSDIVTGVTVQVVDLLPGTSAQINWAQVPASTSSGSTSAGVDSAGTAKTTFIPTVAGNYQVDAAGTTRAGAPWTGSLPVTVLPTCDEGITGGEETTVPVDKPTEPEQVVSGLSDTGGGSAGLLLALGAGALVVGATGVVVSRSRTRGQGDAA